jgi:hypothetical protein
VADRKAFLLRVDRELLDAVQRWAGEELRSLNGQIEFLLREAMRLAGRPVSTSTPQGEPAGDEMPAGQDMQADGQP